MNDQTPETPKAAPATPAHDRALADEILADANRKAERARQRGEREAKKILGKARTQAAEAAAKILVTAQGRADRMSLALMATFETEAQRDLLDAREAELDKLFDAARARLADKAAYGYPGVLAALAAQAIEAMGVDRVVVELAEADRHIADVAWLGQVRSRVGRDVTIDVSDAAAPIAGGLIVRSADGRLLYDNSFAARIERLRPELRRELATKLFAEEEMRDADS